MNAEKNMVQPFTESKELNPRQLINKIINDKFYKITEEDFRNLKIGLNENFEAGKFKKVSVTL